MSETAYYTFNISDLSLRKELKSENFPYNNRKLLKRNVKQSDGDVNVPLTGLGTIIALMVISSKAISLKIDGNVVPVDIFFFSELSSLTSLAIACSDSTDSEVEVVVWGKNA